MSRIKIVLGLLLELPTLACAQDYAAATVRCVNWQARMQQMGTGTLLGSDGRTALVLTCKHILDGGGIGLTVERNRRRYPARLLAVAVGADLSTWTLDDPGGVRCLDLALGEDQAATLCGFGTALESPLRILTGRRLHLCDQGVAYTCAAEEGDSGGGVFTSRGALQGVIWGTSRTGNRRGSLGVPLAAVREFLETEPTAALLRRCRLP